MKKNNKSFGKRALSCLTAVGFGLSMMTVPVYAEDAELTLIEGDIRAGFAGCTSDDPAIAWVDEAGTLRAMKEGTTTLHTDTGDKTVTVKDFKDGSEVVGQLKLLARYNDDMQFYDGHVYLLFTSYQDGVEVTVDDLYAGYEISDDYYADIRADISNGSNHTGNYTDDYFTFNDSMTSVTLDKGELVTIGMYSDFDMSVPQAALGSLQNSTIWESLSSGVKTDIMKALFQMLEKGSADSESETAEFLEKLKEEGIDYNQLLDGVVDGGVCFNRELFNQKLEWDQYENVTYEMDITENQLERLIDSLQGNLNKFSILKNSCATVALNAWNSAVGTRDGEETAYKLEPTGSGIFAFVDAPKTVRDEIVNKLPGYYLNNSEMVQEPNAGYIDDTGWVYVSAPEVDIPGMGEIIPEPDEMPALTVRVKGIEDSRTDVYYKEGAGTVELPLGEAANVPKGTKVYVKTSVPDEDFGHMLSDITLSGTSILDNYDADEGAYFFEMPNKNSTLSISYAEASVELNSSQIQAAVGEELDIADFATLTIDGKDVGSEKLLWKVFYTDPDGTAIISEDGKKLRFTEAGTASIIIEAEGCPGVFELLLIHIFDSSADMSKITYNEPNLGSYGVCFDEEDSDNYLPYSGYLVPNGTKLSIALGQSEPVVVSSFKVNGKKADWRELINVEKDTNIFMDFRNAEIVGMPATVEIADKDGSYELDPHVRYSDLLYRLIPVYDKSITYTSSDECVTVDADGKITVTGDIPEEGKCVIVTAYAGSSNERVYAQTKVILGDYDGAKTVGRLTIWARPAVKDNLTPHGAVQFTSYEDIDLDLSYYELYKPTIEFIDLMREYRDHPENFPSDPAVFSEEIEIADRESWFNISHNSSGAEPETLKLRAGDGITLSDYCFEPNSLMILKHALEGSTLAKTPEGSALLAQLEAYMEKGELDGDVAFDSFLKSLLTMYQMSVMTGHNPLDGICEGGFTFNREIMRQFTTTYTQTPNNYYTVELTADELEAFRAFISAPEHNNYSIFNNCATAAVDAWNTAVSDRPDLQLSANISKLGVDPQSLYVELGMLALKKCEKFDGEGEGSGKDFVPHIVPAYETEDPNGTAPTAVSGLTFDGTAQALVTAGTANKGYIEYALTANSTAPESGWSTEIPTAVEAGTYYVWYRFCDDRGYVGFTGEPAYVTAEIAAGKTAGEIIASAEDVTAEYDGNAHGITVKVTQPASGYTIKYGTEEGVYDLTESPAFTEVGEYAVYYEVTADGYNTFHGKAAVRIVKSAETSTPSGTDSSSSNTNTASQTNSTASATSAAAAKGDAVPNTGRGALAVMAVLLAACAGIVVSRKEKE